METGGTGLAAKRPDDNRGAMQEKPEGRCLTGIPSLLRLFSALSEMSAVLWLH